MLRRFCLAAALALSLASSAHAQDVFRGLYTPDGRVRSASLAGDTLYVGGDFGLVAAPTGPLAVLDKVTGEPDLTQPRVSGLAFQEALQVVLPDGAGGYYVGGEFSGIGGVARRNLAHVLADGTVDPDFAPNPYGEINSFAFGQVEVLALDSGVLYVGGRFDVVGGQPRRNVAALDPSTGALLPLSVTMTSATGADPRGFVETIAVRNGVLYVGGFFDVVNGQAREGLFALDTATGTLLPWNPTLDQDGSSFGEATALGFGETTLYVFGLFDRVRGVARGGSAEVSLADPVTGEGGVPTAWNPGFSGGGPYLTITDGYVWSTGLNPVLYRISRATGQFQSFLNGTPYRFGRQLALDPTGGPSGRGMLYIAASVLHPLAPRSSFPVIVGVDAATGQPTGFEVLGGAGGLGGDYIAALAVEPGPGGRLLAAGSVQQYDGSPRRFLAGLDLMTGRVTDLAEGYLLFSSVAYPQDRQPGFANLAAQRRAVDVFADLIAPFAFEKLAGVQSTTIYGGMENPSAIFYDEGAVADAAGMEALVAHEVAHHWFGNVVTETRWADLWLSEGFATYLTDVYVERTQGRDAMALRLAAERAGVFRLNEGSPDLPVVDTLTADPSGLLNANSYNKGAWVLHMLRREIGDAAFFDGLRAYYTAYRFRNANTSDFRRVMEGVAGRPLGAFFGQWLVRADEPEVEVRWRLDGDAVVVRVVQTQPGPPFTFPLDLGVRTDATGVVRRLGTVQVSSRETTARYDAPAGMTALVADPDVWLLARTTAERDE